jgi:hypothetical protein
MDGLRVGCFSVVFVVASCDLSKTGTSSNPSTGKFLDEGVKTISVGKADLELLEASDVLHCLNMGEWETKGES